jgi:dihydroorotase-like cyclic amidohydrolase
MESSCKTAHDRKVLWEALLDDRIDVIATDHAPHTLEENQSYLKALWRSISATPLWLCLKHIMKEKLA